MTSFLLFRPLTLITSFLFHPTTSIQCTFFILSLLLTFITCKRRWQRRHLFDSCYSSYVGVQFLKFEGKPNPSGACDVSTFYIYFLVKQMTWKLIYFSNDRSRHLYQCETLTRKLLNLFFFCYFHFFAFFELFIIFILYSFHFLLFVIVHFLKASSFISHV